MSGVQKQIVGEADGGQRIDRWLRRMFPHLSQGRIEKMCRKGELRVDGGATINDLLMQYQSDILGCQVVRPEVTETTALGAAYLAGLAVGYWADMDAIGAQWTAERTFSPTLDEAGRQKADALWNRAVRATLAWAEDR